KPTVGRASRAGVIPVARSQDTAGPIARTVTDAALLLAAMSGSDPDDPVTAGGSAHPLGDPLKWLDSNALRGARLGGVRTFFGFRRAVDRVAEQALADMAARGATLVDPVSIPTLGTFADTELDVLLFEFRSGINRYLASLGPAALVRSLADLIEFNDAHADR